MQLYVKLWKARHDWLALSRQERAEFLARSGSAFAATSSESELIGFGLDESESTRQGGYRYVAIWRIHAGSAAARLDSALQHLEWNRYFDCIDSLSPAVSPEAMLRDMATCSVAAEPEQGGLGALFSKLARGLGIGSAPEPRTQDLPAKPLRPPGPEHMPQAPAPPPRPEPVVTVTTQPVAPVLEIPAPITPPAIAVEKQEPALVEFIEQDAPFALFETVESVEESEPSIDFESARLASIPPSEIGSTEAEGFDVDLYLQRIGYTGSREPTADTLRELHRAHLRSVPFENLDIMSGQSIVLDERAFYRKIVDRRRGGICYELNGLFAALLRELGFNVTVLSANVTGEEGKHGPDFDHMVLMVRLEERWLVDIGFGDSFSEPLQIDEVGEQYLPEATYKIYNDAGLRSLLRRNTDTSWSEQFIFTLLPREITDFAAMCDFHQTSPQSPFTHKRICSRLTTDGRVSLSDTHLILSSAGKRRELRLSNPTEYSTMLREYFGIITPE